MAERLEVLITARNLGRRALRQFGRSLDELRALALRTSKVLALIGLPVGFAAGIRTVREMVTAVNAQDRAVKQLEGSLVAVGRATEGSSAGFQEYAAALQSVTGVGDELIIQQEAFLLRLGLSREAIEATTLAALELSDAIPSISFEAAVRNITKTFSGLTGELGELLPDLRDLSEESLRAGGAIDLILDRFGGSAVADLGTLGGQVRLLSADLGDLFERVGSVASQSDALRGAVVAADEAIRGFLTSDEDLGELQRGFDRFIGRAVAGGVVLFETFREAAGSTAELIDRLQRGSFVLERILNFSAAFAQTDPLRLLQLDIRELDDARRQLTLLRSAFLEVDEAVVLANGDVTTSQRVFADAAAAATALARESRVLGQAFGIPPEGFLQLPEDARNTLRQQYRAILEALQIDARAQGRAATQVLADELANLGGDESLEARLQARFQEILARVREGLVRNPIVPTGLGADVAALDAPIRTLREEIEVLRTAGRGRALLEAQLSAVRQFQRAAIEAQGDTEQLALAAERFTLRMQEAARTANLAALEEPTRRLREEVAILGEVGGGRTLLAGQIEAVREFQRAVLEAAGDTEQIDLAGQVLAGQLGDLARERDRELRRTAEAINRDLLEEEERAVQARLDAIRDELERRLEIVGDSGPLADAAREAAARQTDAVLRENDRLLDGLDELGRRGKEAILDGLADAFTTAGDRARGLREQAVAALEDIERRAARLVLEEIFERAVQSLPGGVGTTLSKVLGLPTPVAGADPAVAAATQEAAATTQAAAADRFGLAVDRLAGLIAGGPAPSGFRAPLAGGGLPGAATGDLEALAGALERSSTREAVAAETFGRAVERFLAEARACCEAERAAGALGAGAIGGVQALAAGVGGPDARESLEVLGRAALTFEAGAALVLQGGDRGIEAAFLQRGAAGAMGESVLRFFDAVVRFEATQAVQQASGLIGGFGSAHEGGVVVDDGLVAVHGRQQKEVIVPLDQAERYGFGRGGVSIQQTFIFGSGGGVQASSTASGDGGTPDRRLAGQYARFFEGEMLDLIRREQRPGGALEGTGRGG